MACGLYFEAGKEYLKKGCYTSALYCFQQCEAYRHTFYCYQKLGQASLAIEVAEKHGLHKQGALLCMHTKNYRKAAYFYSLFDSSKAIKLYKKLGANYELAHCYLANGRFFLALQSFLNCQDPLHKLEGMRLMEEVAIVLYLTKQYEEAIKLFTELHDYHSVLECAKKLQNSSLIETTSRQLSLYELEEGNLFHAAHLIAPYHKRQARLYYYLATINNEELTLAIYEKRYFHALTFCFHSNNLLLAKEISKYWLYDSNPSSLSLTA